MTLDKEDKRWIKETLTEGLNQTVMPVLDDIKQELGEHREMINYVTERVGELTVKVDENTEQIDILTKKVDKNTEQIEDLTIKVDELDTKIDKVDRKLTVVGGHLGVIIDNHEKRIRSVEVAL